MQYARADLFLALIDLTAAIHDKEVENLRASIHP